MPHAPAYQRHRHSKLWYPMHTHLEIRVPLQQPPLEDSMHHQDTKTSGMLPQTAHLEPWPPLPQQVVHRIAQAEHGGIVVLGNGAQIVLDGAPEEGRAHRLVLLTLHLCTAKKREQGNQCAAAANVCCTELGWDGGLEAKQLGRATGDCLCKPAAAMHQPACWKQNSC